MKKIAAILLLTIFSSCNNEDSIDEITINNLEIEKNNLFTNETANLTFEANGYDDIKVTTNNDATISIDKINNTTYKISASEAVMGRITVSLTNEDPENDTTETIDINFYEHGTKDYHTFEGIVIDNDYKDKVVLLHGEPDGVRTRINNDGNEFQDLIYFSKGFIFTIHTKVILNQKFNNIVTSVTPFAFSPWSLTLDGEVKKGGGVTYPYDIAELGNFNNLSGILMDKVIEKHGLTTEDRKSQSNSGTIKRYDYSDLSPTIAKRQGCLFFFSSDDLNNFKGKRIRHIVIY